MKTALALFALLCGNLFAIAVPGGGSFPLTATPAALSTGLASNYVNQLRIQVTPGQSCKVYISRTASTSPGSLLAVLYPNPNGGHSEAFSIQDPRSGDGLDLTKFYLWTDCPGESAIVEWFQTGTQLAEFKPYVYGVKGVTSTSGTIFTSAVDSFYLLQVQVLPGYVGKVHVGRAGGTSNSFLTLYPNFGNWNQNNAHSERWSLARSAGIRADQFFLYADVLGEGAIVNVWGV